MTETTIQTPTSVPTVTVFSKNDCSACDATKDKLTAAGVPFREINVEEDTEPRAEFGNETPLTHVIEKYGRSMPAVVVEDDQWGDFWLGRRYDKLVALIHLFQKLGAIIPEEDRISCGQKV